LGKITGSYLNCRLKGGTASPKDSSDDDDDDDDDDNDG
jgi:hypothetical protein